MKTYYAVYAEHTLGLVFENNGRLKMSILRASVLRGSSFNELSGPIEIAYPNELRAANEKDFNDYRVSSKYHL